MVIHTWQYLAWQYIWQYTVFSKVDITKTINRTIMTIQRVYAWIGFFTFWTILILGTYELVKWLIWAHKFINAYGY